MAMMDPAREDVFCHALAAQGVSFSTGTGTLHPESRHCWSRCKLWHSRLTRVFLASTPKLQCSFQLSWSRQHFGGNWRHPLLRGMIEHLKHAFLSVCSNIWTAAIHTCHRSFQSSIYRHQPHRLATWMGYGGVGKTPHSVSLWHGHVFKYRWNNFPNSDFCLWPLFCNIFMHGP